MPTPSRQNCGGCRQLKADPLTEFLAFAEAALGEPLGERTVCGLSLIQTQLRVRTDEMTALLRNGAMSREKYLEQHNIALRDAMKASEALLGRDRFLEVFGEAGDCPEGLIDRDAFLAEEFGKFPLHTIAFVDCEASSLGSLSYPIEIGWCLADTGTTDNGSCLIVPAPSWTDWDFEAERVHGISRRMLQAEGVSVSQAAELLSSSIRARTLYADSSHDVKWIHRLFDVAGLQPPAIRAFDRLLDQVVRPEPNVAGDTLSRDLARAELQGKLIDAAYAYADRVAPKIHRAGPDAYYLFTVFRRAQIIGSSGIDDLLAPAATLRDLSGVRRYKADNPNAVLSNRVLTTTRVRDRLPDLDFAFDGIPTIVTLRRDHPDYDIIRTLLVESKTTGKPLVVTIDWRAVLVAGVRWPNLAEFTEGCAVESSLDGDEGDAI
jgi:hypothetical protein